MEEQDHRAESAIRAVFDRVIADGLAPESVAGATEEQIDAFAAGQGVGVVPAAVRAVLRLLGVRQGLWRAGSSLGVDAVGADAKRYAQATLSRDGGAVRDAGGLLVLLSHQAYEFHVVDGADLGAPDPPVWLVSEGDGAQPVWPSVSQWFAAISPDVDAYRSRLELMLELGHQAPSWAGYLTV